MRDDIIIFVSGLVSGLLIGGATGYVVCHDSRPVIAPTPVHQCHALVPVNAYEPTFCKVS